MTLKTFHISVGELVSFLYASGDLSTETFQNVSLLEGTKAHQYLQSLYKSNDESEIPIKDLIMIDDTLSLELSGRIDGLLMMDETLVMEEIKSTRKPIFDDLFTPNLEHVAQLKMYAYMYMKKHHLTDIKTRLTYIELSTYQTRSFYEIYDIDLLKPFYDTSINLYLDWLYKLAHHIQEKKETLETLVFPFDPYRRGQRTFMTAVYQTMMDQDILYAIAPTGIGKTMAALFSSLKSLHEDEQKIFYLTAKTQGKKVAIDTMDILHEAGLKSKTLELTSRDTICFQEKRECDPNKCPFAKGFFDRLKDAMMDIFEHETLMKRETVELYARKHMVCPFEFSLYVSYFVDVIICDYNYVFDPRAHLIRYFEDTTYKPLLLIDESHNLIQRSRDMYSSTLKTSDLITLRRQASKLKPSIRNAVKKVLDAFMNYEEKLGGLETLHFKTMDDDFMDSLLYLLKKIEKAIKETPNYPKKHEVMEGYLSILGFTRLYEYYNDAYVTIVESKDDDIYVTMQCLDASMYLYDIMKQKAYGTVLFSATLYPTPYYQTLLTKGQGETLKIRSPFNPDHLKLVVMDHISTRYQDRLSSIPFVIDVIKSVIEAKKGNYIVFFPSYQYLNQIYDALPQALKEVVMIQERDMSHITRNETLKSFENINQNTLAFFVMGGMFAEGIDYVGDMLHGVICVGVGLPQLSYMNQLLKDYYELKFNQGFDYAYTYPGMNKVIQAVGRVIRRDEDRGIAILIDDRFNTGTYKKLFPIEWKKPEVIRDKDKLSQALIKFWKNM
ncbi:MAG: ATP-dependent DNA helicase [Tenericutes bacterium HGW-Tenericutes-6]|nr:MAG: ATP-dependent DNA helicase [Tenericutes bacterium HGW-Tenericutes-6]